MFNHACFFLRILHKYIVHVGVEDYRIKCIDAKAHRIKGGTDCSSYGKLVVREDKDSMPRAEKHADNVDNVHDLICSIDK